MIPIFRKTRKQMADDNKPLKYIRYAIGEIILVVIGILIALQINNWNEERKAFTKSKNYLTEILKDLEADTFVFKKAVENISESIEADEWALSRTDYKPNQIDSIWDSFGGWYFNYSINDRTFQKIQNAGDSKLVGYDSVMNQITNYYTKIKESLDSYVDWDKKEVTERQAYMQDIEEYIEISNYRMNSLGSGSLEKEFVVMQDSLAQTRNVIDFAKSTRGRNHYKNNYIRHKRVRNSFETVRREALNLISTINQELK